MKVTKASTVVPPKSKPHDLERMDSSVFTPRATSERVTYPITAKVPNVKNEKPVNDSLVPMRLENQNNVSINLRSKEYSWDTPDGKHRVYMRNRSDEAGPLPKKEQIDDYNKKVGTLINGDGYGKYGKEPIDVPKDIDDMTNMGVSKDILDLLKEEEKFYKKQAELKSWRQERESVRNGNPSNKPNSTNSNHNFVRNDRARGSRRDASPDKNSKPSLTDHQVSARKERLPTKNERPQERQPSSQRRPSEEQRMEEEDRLAAEAKRLMQFRAAQARALKRSNDNIVDGPPRSGATNPNPNMKDRSSRGRPEERKEHSKRLHEKDNNRTDRDHSPTSIYENANSWEPKIPERTYRREIHDPDLVDKQYRDNQRDNRNKVRARTSVTNEPIEYSKGVRFGVDDSGRSPGRIRSTKRVSGYLSPDSEPIFERSRDSIIRGQKSPENSRSRIEFFSDDDNPDKRGRRDQREPTRNPTRRPSRPSSARTSPRRDEVDNRGYFSDPDVFREVYSNPSSRLCHARPIVLRQTYYIKCTACKRVISDERIMNVDGADVYWHLSCFFCVVCRMYLNNSNMTVRVRLVNNKVHCRYCYSASGGKCNLYKYSTSCMLFVASSTDYYPSFLPLL